MPDDLTRLRIGFFSRSVVSRVARERGLFEAHGLSVSEQPVPSSPAQFEALRDGAFDMVLTSPDNVAAYRLTDANPLGARMDVRIVMALDAGLGLSVMARPDIADLAALRGRTIAVDVPASGFALAMFEILRRRGLDATRDVTVLSLGSTPGRREALLAGRCDATLLNAGHDIRAELAGFRRLVRITDVLSPYLGAVLATTGGWLDTHLTTARRFADAWLAATAVVVDPAERDFVLPLVAQELAVDGDGAARAHRMLCSDREGLVRDGSVEVDRLQTVLSIRAAWGGPQTGVDASTAGIARSGIVDARVLQR